MVKSMVKLCLLEFSDFTWVFSVVKVLCNRPLVLHTQARYTLIWQNYVSQRYVVVPNQGYVAVCPCRVRWRRSWCQSRRSWSWRRLAQSGRRRTLTSHWTERGTGSTILRHSLAAKMRWVLAQAPLMCNGGPWTRWTVLNIHKLFAPSFTTPQLLCMLHACKDQRSRGWCAKQHNFSMTCAVWPRLFARISHCVSCI